MLNIETPAQFILSLHFSPFMLECIFLLLIALLLSNPLLTRIENIMNYQSKLFKVLQPDAPKREKTFPMIWTRYPVMPMLLNINSSSTIDFLALRIISSTPASHDITDCDKTNASNIYPQAIECSSTFIPTNIELPIVDISSFEYNSYRYRLIESLFERLYGYDNPPGGLVLKFLQLNEVASCVNTHQCGQNSTSLNSIDVPLESDKTVCIPERIYMHPLDHFLGKKSLCKRTTVDAGTEINIEDNDGFHSTTTFTMCPDRYANVSEKSTLREDIKIPRGKVDLQEINCRKTPGNKGVISKNSMESSTVVSKVSQLSNGLKVSQIRLKNLKDLCGVSTVASSNNRLSHYFRKGSSGSCTNSPTITYGKTDMTGNRKITRNLSSPIEKTHSRFPKTDSTKLVFKNVVRNTTLNAPKRTVQRRRQNPPKNLSNLSKSLEPNTSCITKT
ncbi:uncharacterized protein LOC112493717 [Cephus cinctus]|uniref:Uncharacterized protein LOC112493717 n=1 Tax=Cephus cinctus TaxID=211228 RepID=A0AAJ7R8G6_CEPCN|nr:uncharacterized protein LOC112493717 [Cephus cinctus]